MLKELFIGVAQAANPTLQGIYANDYTPATNNPFTMLNVSYDKIYTLVVIVSGVISVGVLMWGGIKYIIAGGDSKKATDAKNIIVKSIIGIIVITSTYGLINLAKGVSSKLNKIISDKPISTSDTTPTDTPTTDPTPVVNLHPSEQAEINAMEAENNSKIQTLKETTP